MVFQDLALWPNLTVLENVLMGMNREKAFRETAVSSLSICGIAELSAKYPGEISGGEQQRLALARALATRPEFLFLDEPFNGLDIEIKNSIINKIKVLAEENNITIALVSHDPFEVLSLCRHIIVLEQGQIAERGELRTLLADPSSGLMRVFREYLLAFSRPECRQITARTL
jgi:ABC-type sulfate/molybdate transport systems ATPase subunit